MRRLTIGALIGAILLTSFTPIPVQAQRSEEERREAAVAIAAIVTAATIAAARDHDRDRERERERERLRDLYRYPTNYRRHDDKPDMWYPAVGVTCYRKLRQCYQVGAGYSARWTHREF